MRPKMLFPIPKAQIPKPPAFKLPLIKPHRRQILQMQPLHHRLHQYRFFLKGIRRRHDIREDHAPGRTAREEAIDFRHDEGAVAGMEETVLGPDDIEIGTEFMGHGFEGAFCDGDVIRDALVGAELVVAGVLEAAEVEAGDVAAVGFGEVAGGTAVAGAEVEEAGLGGEVDGGGEEGGGHVGDGCVGGGGYVGWGGVVGGGGG